MLSSTNSEPSNAWCPLEGHTCLHKSIIKRFTLVKMVTIKVIFGSLLTNSALFSLPFSFSKNKVLCKLETRTDNGKF